MGRPRKGDVAYTTVSVRLDPRVIEVIAERAKGAGMTRSAYLAAKLTVDFRPPDPRPLIDVLADDVMLGVAAPRGQQRAARVPPAPSNVGEPPAPPFVPTPDSSTAAVVCRHPSKARTVRPYMTVCDPEKGGCGARLR